MSALKAKSLRKKDIRKTIQEKLTVTLADYRTVVGKKKFDNRIRKVARRLGEDIVSALPAKGKKKNKSTSENLDPKMLQQAAELVAK